MVQVIIIPVHNQLPYLIKCVTSVFKYTTNPELIIVDDGSTDEETRDWITRNEKPLQYTLIRHETAMGFSRACNDAIDFAMANFDFQQLCLLNSDAEIITDDWFGKVSTYMNADDKIGIAGVMSDNALVQSVPNVDRYLIGMERRPTVYSYFIHGFCYFISRKLIMTIGKLDEVKFPHYGSEDDYSLKSVQYGFSNILVGSVLVKHKNMTSYNAARRGAIVNTSSADLVKRWSYGLVNKCGNMSNKAAKHVLQKK